MFCHLHGIIEPRLLLVLWLLLPVNTILITSGEEESSSKGAKNQGNYLHIDVTSPYYFHASDYLGQIFFSEPLHDNNYSEWVIDMSNALYAKNKIEFVDGSVPMPRADSNKLALWMRCNAMVKG